MTSLIGPGVAVGVGQPFTPKYPDVYRFEAATSSEGGAVLPIAYGTVKASALLVEKYAPTILPLPVWTPGGIYRVGDRVRTGTQILQCVTAGTAGASIPYSPYAGAVEETHAVPAVPGPYTITVTYSSDYAHDGNPTYGVVVNDLTPGVTYTALFNSAPIEVADATHYYVTAGGVYHFDSSLAGHSVKIRYTHNRIVDNTVTWVILSDSIVDCYTQNFVAALAEGPVEEVKKIWIDKECLDVGFGDTGRTYENKTVPAVPPYTFDVTYKSSFIRNIEVRDGVTLLTEVTGTPGAGEYQCIGGTYTFHASAAGHSMAITYCCGALMVIARQIGFSPGSGPNTALPALFDTTQYPNTAVLYSQKGACQISKREIPAYAVEMVGYRASSSVADVNPADIIYDLLTHPRRGLGISPARIDAASLTGMGATSLRTYCDAAGLVCSMYIDGQRPALELLKDLLTIANFDCISSGGKLKFVPRGTVTIGSFIPNNTAVYNISSSHFLTPIQIRQASIADVYNEWPVTYTCRADNYQTRTDSVVDLASSVQWGQTLRADPVKLPVIFPSATPAIRVAGSLLRTALDSVNEYTFSLPWTFMLLEPGDIVTLTDASVGLSLVPVKITEIREDDNGLQTVAVDWPTGIAAMTPYAPQSGSGYAGSELNSLGDAPRVIDRFSYSTGEGVVGVSGLNPNINIANKVLNGAFLVWSSPATPELSPPDGWECIGGTSTAYADWVADPLLWGAGKIEASSTACQTGDCSIKSVGALGYNYYGLRMKDFIPAAYLDALTLRILFQASTTVADYVALCWYDKTKAFVRRDLYSLTYDTVSTWKSDCQYPLVTPDTLQYLKVVLLRKSDAGTVYWDAAELYTNRMRSAKLYAASDQSRASGDEVTFGTVNYNQGTLVKAGNHNFITPNRAGVHRVEAYAKITIASGKKARLTLNYYDYSDATWKILAVGPWYLSDGAEMTLGVGGTGRFSSYGVETAVFISHNVGGNITLSSSGVSDVFTTIQQIDGML